MTRIVAMHSNGVFWAAKIVYDRNNVIDLLNQKFALPHAAKCLISSGDMLALTGESPMRSSNSARARMIPDFAGIIAFMRKTNAHTLSIHDQHGAVMEMIGNWMMECDEDEDLFVQNISEDRAWHHVLDNYAISKTAMAALKYKKQILCNVYKEEKIMVTQAQRDAATALDLPFVLSDDDIMRQFDAEGNPIVRANRNPMNRVRELSRGAMNDQQAVTPLAA